MSEAAVAIKEKVEAEQPVMRKFLSNLRHEGEKKTHMDCHQCHKHFTALVDYSLNGNHAIECPFCGHEHQRVIKDGEVTEERWGSFVGDKIDPHKPRRVWKHNSLPAATSGAADFLRDRWLERSQD